jgi:cytochrome c-type biogenesis protein CcmH/NrfF
MKRLALSALAALACSAITVSAQAAPVSGVGKLAATSQASSLVDNVRCCHCHYYRPVFWHRCHRRWWW